MLIKYLSHKIWKTKNPATFIDIGTKIEY
jgi:hypothetical protein